MIKFLMKTKKKEKEFTLKFCIHLEKGKLYGLLSNKPHTG